MRLSLPLFSLVDDLGINNAALATWATRIVGLIIVWSIVWILVRYLSRWLAQMDTHVDTFHVSARDLKTLDRLLDYITILVGLIISLAILGWTSLLYSALTAAGLFSVMIGFAVRDVAANFISGIFILIDQPFAPGDYIEVGKYAGTVKDISLRSTTLTTIDGPVIFIPNSVLSVEATINYSIAENRRINFIISVANDANISQALKIIEQVLADEEGLLADQAQSVLVNQVREYAVDIVVMCYAPRSTWLKLSSELKQRVMTTLQGSGVELAVPTRKNINVAP